MNTVQKFTIENSMHPDISHFYTFKTSTTKQMPQKNALRWCVFKNNDLAL